MDFIKKELEVLLKEIKDLLKQQQLIRKNEFITLEEASEFLGLSKSCIYKMTSKKEVPHYKRTGKKIYFKPHELEKWIFDGRVAPYNESDDEMDSYLSRPDKV